MMCTEPSKKSRHFRAAHALDNTNMYLYMYIISDIRSSNTSYQIMWVAFVHYSDREELVVFNLAACGSIVFWFGHCMT